jgi:folate-binding protein YgfZ
MSMPAGIDLSTGPGALGVLGVSGPDAARFLQGQLSAEIENLAPGSSTLAGLHNPQGRTVALLALARVRDDELLAALPAELMAAVTQRLRKYVLRAKVRIEDLSSTLKVLGAAAGPAVAAAQIGWGDRRLLLAPTGRPDTDASLSHDEWQLADVRQGLPQVYAATSEAFVAQMLNLDLLGAIAFDKGCYTGQEVIARAHYRGRVKRRLQRWLNTGAVMLKPGDAARTRDGRALTVVRVAALADGRQELLAVGPFAAPAVTESATEPGVEIDGPLSLPYSLPD